jgi:HEAT repeat protein
MKKPVDNSGHASHERFTRGYKLWTLLIGTLVVTLVALTVLLWQRRENPAVAPITDPSMIAIQNMVASGKFLQATARLDATSRFDKPAGLRALRDFSLIVLRRGLKEPSLYDQCFAASALAAGGENQGLRLLVDTFDKNPDLSLKMAVADGLGEDGNRRAVEILGQLYSEAKPFERRIIVEGLSSARDPSAATVLIEATHASDEMVRLGALKALGELGNRSAIPRLRQVVASKKHDAFDRVMASRSLILLGDKSVVPYLSSVLFDHSQDERARAVAAVALGFAKDPAALPLLKQALTDQKLDVRIGAAAALTHYGDPAGAEYLESSLVNSDDISRLEISQLFKTLDQASGRPVILAGLRSKYMNVKLAAIKALATPGSERNAEVLIGLLRETKDSTVRAQIAWALGHIGSPGSIQVLLVMVSDPKPVVRYTAAASLNLIATHLLAAGKSWDRAI